MVIAAAEVKPDIMGKEMKSTINPKYKKPPIANNIVVMSVVAGPLVLNLIIK